MSVLAKSPAVSSVPTAKPYWQFTTMGGWMDGEIDAGMGGWMDGWMDGWIDGWMDGWILNYNI